MNYQELIAKALKGRPVMTMAKAWGVNNVTLTRYVKGERLPDFDTALKMAKEAGVDPGEAFEALASAERLHKAKQFKLQSGFVQIELLALLATGGLIAPLLYYVKYDAELDTHYFVILIPALGSHHAANVQ